MIAHLTRDAANKYIVVQIGDFVFVEDIIKITEAKFK